MLPSGSRLAMNSLLARFLAEEKSASSRKQPLAVAKAPQVAPQAANQIVAASSASASIAAPQVANQIVARMFKVFYYFCSGNT